MLQQGATVVAYVAATAMIGYTAVALTKRLAHVLGRWWRATVRADQIAYVREAMQPEVDELRQSLRQLRDENTRAHRAVERRLSGLEKRLPPQKRSIP